MMAIIRTSTDSLAFGVLGALLFVVVYQAVTAEVLQPAPQPQENQPCTGQPIEVPYPYGGGLMEPHACKPQCDDGQRRYLLYTNGKATQCEPLPGCNDWGEDSGVTCVPQG